MTPDGTLTDTGPLFALLTPKVSLSNMRAVKLCFLCSSRRILALMEQYQDRPMDLADASLIALAEARGYQCVFSIDSDFYVYRLSDGSALEVVPGPLRGM